MEPGNDFFPAIQVPFSDSTIHRRGPVSRQAMQNQRRQSVEEVVREMYASDVILPRGYVEAVITADVVCPINLRELPEEGSMVVLIPDRHNNDKIKLYNSDALMIGRLERGACIALAPFMLDDTVLGSKGFVEPASPMWRRDNGHLFVYRLRCRFHVGVWRSEVDRVCRMLAEQGIDIEFTAADVDINVWSPYVEPQYGLKEIRGGDMNRVFKILENNNMSKRASAQPVDANKAVVKTEMLVHQKEALGWLLERENSNELPPFWKEKGAGVYSDLLFDMRTTTRPDSIRGGIYADDSGLGKTLTLLALIAHDKCPTVVNKSARVTTEAATCCRLSDVNGQEVSSWRGPVIREVGESSGSGKRKRSDDMDDDGPHRTTLVVCPPNICTTWTWQIANHTNPRSLRVHEYIGRNKASNVDCLAQYDVVITTYRTLAAEVSSSDQNDSPLINFNWWRVILDEAADEVKNVQSTVGKAVMKLKASRRWAVTPTFMQHKRRHDLYPIMVFLKLDPYTDEIFWRSMISDPVSKGEWDGLERFRVLMAAISWRRTKEEAGIKLTSKNVDTYYVDLPIEGREVYNEVESESRDYYNSYIIAHRRARRSHYSALLSGISRLMQICDTPSLCHPRYLRDVSDEPELQEKLAMDAEENGFDHCPICFSEQPTCLSITPCGHTFCLRCILTALRRNSINNPCCPMCRHPVTHSDLLTSRNQPHSSAKISALVSLLSASRNENNPSTKTVVFSDYKRMLIILDEELSRAGFNTLRIDGSNSHSTNCINQFINSVGPTILLATLQVCKSGIDLSAATRVYLFEPHCDPAVEDQAISRVHHIGQKEDVTIIRLITRNSIEERILELQNRKRRLRMATVALSSTVVNDDRTDIEDLGSLMWT